MDPTQMAILGECTFVQIMTYCIARPFSGVICVEEELMSGTLPINSPLLVDHVLITPVMANE